MIDSVLKGTGNSRFLKSAVPAGTSWADALAMLQAGTFPIDFNGINTEGFQQVGTPLNKANLLKDATAAQIGLPPSTTPDGMFQALGNTGELHVWRKTVTTAQEIPAGYTLGSGTSLTLVKSTQRYGQGSTYWVPATSISVNDGGAINEITGSSVQVYYEKEESELKSAFWGKFIKFSSESDYGNVPDKDGVWFIPSSATIQKTTGGNYYYLTVVGAQKVNPYPLTPAGTTTTYPVSTNPNAYQEGDDAKAAGYVVGEVKTDKKVVSALSNGGNTVYWTFSNTLTVADDGTISLANGTTLSLRALDSDAVSNAQPLIGKYACFSSMGTETTGTDFPLNQVIFFPSDTTFTMVSKVENGINKNTIQASKYQPVTGYAAIPAGTTIEYLGKLGDKARVQFGSYVGTGTFGVSNPNTLNLSFTPRFLLVMTGDGYLNYANFALFVYGTTYGISVGPSSGNKEIPLTMVWGKNSVSWSCNDTSYGQVGQMNNSGTKYRYVAIG